MMQRVLRLALPLVLLATASCSSSSHEHEPEQTGDSGNAIGCQNDPRVKQFAAGLKAQSASGKFSAEIVNAEPSPPRRGAGELGMNSWKMKLLLDGQPVGQDVAVTTFMPDHGHGSPKVPVVSAEGDGSAKVDTLFFFMAGVWEITFTPKSAREPAIITLCVQ